MKRYAFPLTIILLLFAVIALAAPGDKRPVVTSAAIGLGTSSSPTLASITATTSVTAPTFASSAADGYHYIMPYNSIAFAGTPSIGMLQTTPTGPAWYSSDGWEFLSVFPVQTGNSGKFLTTDGSSVSWATVSAGDSLPSQTGNSGKYLTTNGTAASWGTIAAGSGIAISTAIPTETGAANLNDSTHVLTVASSTGYTQFTGSFTAWDTTPDAFSFTDETDIALSTAKTSNAITVAGTNYPATISVSGDTGFGYSKNSAACTATSGTVVAGDTVAACVTSSGSNSTATTATVTIGGVSDTYSVTTAAGYSDYFSSDNNPLPSPWAKPSFSGANAVKSLSGVAKGTVDGSQNLAYYSTWIGTDQCSQILVVARGANAGGPSVRMSATADTFYWAATDGPVRKRIAGTETTIGSLGTSVADGDTLKICASGTTLTIYKNGSLTSTINSQSDIADGYPGFRVTSTGAAYDNWVGSIP